MPATTRRFTKTLRSTHSRHTLFIGGIDRSELPAKIAADATEWQSFYEVRNFDAEGVVFFYLAKGYRHPSPEYANDPSAHAPRQITAYYPNGQMWSGCGDNLQDAVDGAQRDGWMYAH